MTGWVTEADTLGKAAAAAKAPTPSAATLSEVAAAGQRVQLEALVTAIQSHPDLAARLYAALRQSP